MNLILDGLKTIECDQEQGDNKLTPQEVQMNVVFKDIAEIAIEKILLNPDATIDLATKSVRVVGKMLAPVAMPLLSTIGNASMAVSPFLSTLNLAGSLTGLAVNMWGTHELGGHIDRLGLDIERSIATSSVQLHSHLADMHGSLLGQMGMMDRKLVSVLQAQQQAYAKLDRIEQMGEETNRRLRALHSDLLEHHVIVMSRVGKMHGDLRAYGRTMIEEMKGLRDTLHKHEMASLHGALQTYAQVSRMGDRGMMANILGQLLPKTNVIVNVLQGRVNDAVVTSSGLASYPLFQRKAFDTVAFAQAAILRCDVLAALGQEGQAADFLKRDMAIIERVSDHYGHEELDCPAVYAHPRVAAAISIRRLYNAWAPFNPGHDYDAFVRQVQIDLTTFMQPAGKQWEAGLRRVADANQIASDEFVKRCEQTRDAYDSYYAATDEVSGPLIASQALGWVEKLIAVRVAAGSRIQVFEALRQDPSLRAKLEVAMKHAEENNNVLALEFAS